MRKRKTKKIFKAIGRGILCIFKLIQLIFCKLGDFLEEIADDYRWLRDKKKLREERRLEEMQYTDVQMQLSKMQKDCKIALEKTKHLEKVCNAYLTQCKNLRKKIMEGKK